MNSLDELSFIQLLWGVPILLAIHNLEEAPRMEKWSRDLPLPIHPVISTRQFTAAVTLLTSTGFILTYLGTLLLPQPTGVLLILGMQMIMLLNTIAPHMIATIWFRKYSPGVVTGLLLNIPFSFYLFQGAFHEGYLTTQIFWILLVIAPFAMIALAFVSLLLGKLFTK